ncbi:MAG: nucleotide exchange factor GrpE [Kineosporiaceae bacterium]
MSPQPDGGAFAPGGAFSGTAGGEAGDEQERPVVRDKRRLDPETGRVREVYSATEPDPADAAGAPDAGPDAVGAPDAAGSPAAGAPGGAGDELSADLVAAQKRSEELLGDLQRLQAEYVNYRRRVERDRDVARGTAVAAVLESLLPVLDDVHLARQHGDLDGGPFAAIAEKLETTLQRFGLQRYGAPGEAFDPAVHEALMNVQAELPEGTETTTVVQVLQPGYRTGDKVLRAARVAVADPQ